MTLEAEVVIVGGGPTGLMLAGELALAGVRVTVLERRSERVRQSRALSMHSRSVEILALRGLAERFIERGIPRPSSHFAQLGTRLDFSALESSFAFGLVIPQTLTEQLLEEWALEVGATVRRGWQVDAVAEAADEVRVSGDHAGGRFELRPRYVVGADGARSTVRGACQIPFPGTDTDQTYYFGDVYLGGTGAPNTGRFAVHSEDGGVEAFPIANGRHRMIFIDPARFSVPLSVAVTLDEMQEGVERIMGPGILLSDPSWMSRFGNETRLAAQYRKGRIFLAGDAAHIHLPAGGQGMNTGLQDAMNLGWKLGGALRGRAPEAILDSYETERRPVGQRLIDNTRAQEAILSGAGFRGVALRALMNQLLEIPVVNRFLADMITAMDTTYSEPLLRSHDRGDPEWAGRRLADVQLRLSDGRLTSLYASMHQGNWLDLRLDEEPAAPAPHGIDPCWIRSVRATLIEDPPAWRNVAGVLVRPDGHVASARMRTPSLSPVRQ